MAQTSTKRLNPKATQTLLAFGSLILLIVIFTIASPNFFRPDNLVGISCWPPQSTASWRWV